MNILFTLVSIDVDKQEKYLQSAHNLILEILNQTSYDIFLSTNRLNFFSNINNSRCFIRNNICDNSIFNYGYEFNYNLKHHAFKDIPAKYDYIIYLDCDIKLNSWTDQSKKFMTEIMSQYDFGADRLNCVLRDEIGYFKNNQNCLFAHKITNYNLLQRLSPDDDLMNAQLPSEHFLILKNDVDKLKKFQEKWQEQNDYLQSTNCCACSWGDGFEIGIAARYAGYHNSIPLSPFYWKDTLGFQFNGNKY
jgi:hypothetical protein